MPTVSYLLERFEHSIAHIISYSRTRSGIGHVRRHLGELEFDKLTKEAILWYWQKRRQDGLAERGKEIAYSTILRELGILQTALEQALSDREIPYVPKILKPERGEPRPVALVLPQVWQLLNAIAEGTEIHLFVMIALHTGARLSAICELTWSQIDFYLVQIDFRSRDERAARMKPRAILPMCETLRDILLVARAASAHERLFSASVRTIQRYFDEAVQIAGLPDIITPHTMRHTALTMVIIGLADNEVKRGGMSYLLAARVAAHKSVTTTETNYIHLAVGELRPAMGAVERGVDYAGFKKNRHRIDFSRLKAGWTLAA